MKRIHLLRATPLLFALIAIVACKDKTVSEPWCEDATIAKLQALTGTQAGSNTCATVQGNVVFRKNTKTCPGGAYYLEDSTGTMFLCDPSIQRADSSQGIVTCPQSLLKETQADTAFTLRVKAEGLYYPAKPICDDLMCKCQNGLEVDRMETLD